MKKKVLKPRVKKTPEVVETPAVELPIPEVKTDICKLCGQIVNNHFFKDLKCKPHHHHTFTP
jgi:hypothetical protein